MRQINYPVEQTNSKGKNTDVVSIDVTMHPNAGALNNTFKYQLQILILASLQQLVKNPSASNLFQHFHE